MADDPTGAVLDELARLADVNLAETWTELGRVSGAAVGGSEGCVFVATGIPAAFFNGVYATGPVDDPDRVIADAVEFMGDQGVPWLVWVREGVDDALLDAGRRAGLADAGGPPGMVMAPITGSPPLPDGLRVEIVDDEGGLETFRDLTVRGFEMPREIVERFVTDGVLDHPDMAIAIGSVDGDSVSCALVSITGSTAGVYNVGTPPEFRRRGYGAALTWAVIAEAARRGCDHAVLQASELGAPVYRAMGFVDVGRYVQLEGGPSA